MPTRETHKTSRRPTPARALFLAALAASALLATETRIAHAETCTTQSGLSEPDRNALSDAARALAVDVQTNNASALRTTSVAEVQKSFGSLQYLVALTAPKLAGAPTVEQIYVLDATTLKRNTDGSAPDAQFFCSLNRSTMEADFVIPALPPGKYGFAIVTLPGAPPATQPWRLSLLLRQEQGKWLLAGFYPKALTAAGHDGLWYWTQARQFAKDKQPWNAWLYYQEAGALLRPADFVLSTHLDKLRTETTAATPPALSEGISPDAPLVVKAASGDEYRFTGLGVDDSLGQPALDIDVHLRADPPTSGQPDAAAATKRNADATRALLAAYPELRKPFHGVRMIAQSANAQPFATEQAMADIK